MRKTTKTSDHLQRELFTADTEEKSVPRKVGHKTDISIFSKPNSSILTISNLTFRERITFNALLANSLSHLGKKRVHSLSCKEYCLNTGYKHKDYRELKRTLARLRQAGVQWGSLENDDEPWEDTGWLASSRVDKGVIYFEFSKKMEDELIRRCATNYTRLDLLIQKRLSTRHGLALYEICKKFAPIFSTGWHPVTWWFDALVGDKKTYSEWRVFKRSILIPAVNEVNKETDIYLTLSSTGRPVEFLLFKIKPNPDFQNPLLVESQNNSAIPASDDIKNKLRQFNLTTKAIDEISKIHNTSTLVGAIEYVENQIQTDKIRGDVAGYAYKTLLHFNSPCETTTSVTKLDANKRASEINKQSEINQYHLATREYEKYRRAAVKENFDNMPDGKKQRFLIQFENHVSSLPINIGSKISAAYKKTGIDLNRKSMLSSYFITYFIDSKMVDVISSETFIKEKYNMVLPA